MSTSAIVLAQTFDMPYAAVALLTKDKTAMRVAAEYVSGDRPSMLNEVIPLESNLVYQQFLNLKTPLVTSDACNDPRLTPTPYLLRRRETVSLLILPLIIEDQVVGSMGLESTEPRDFSPEEVSLIH